jgi:hypothetical protein
MASIAFVQNLEATLLERVEDFQVDATPMLIWGAEREGSVLPLYWDIEQTFSILPAH